jgi:hypothetical protein
MAKVMLSLKAFTSLKGPKELDSYRTAMQLIDKLRPTLSLMIVDLPEAFIPDVQILTPSWTSKMKEAAGRDLPVATVTIKLGTVFTKTIISEAVISIPHEVISGSSLRWGDEVLGSVNLGARYWKTLNLRDKRDDSLRKAESLVAQITRFALSPYEVWSPTYHVERRLSGERVARIYVEVGSEIHVREWASVPAISSALKGLRDPGGVVAAVLTTKGAGKSSALRAQRLKMWDVLYDSDFYYRTRLPEEDYPYNLDSRNALDAYFAGVAEAYSAWTMSIYNTRGTTSRLVFVHFGEELDVHKPNYGLGFILVPQTDPYVAMQFRRGLPLTTLDADGIPAGIMLSIKSWENRIKAGAFPKATLQDLGELGKFLRSVREAD